MAAALELAPVLGSRKACRVLGVCRATFHRRRQPPKERRYTRRVSVRALSEKERQTVLSVLHSDRFGDKAPAEVYATLLEESQYLCSIRTMYRLLAENGEVKERRAQRKHPVYTKPELLATTPNQVWSWDITKLKGPVKYRYFNLYVIIDIFSRMVVGWLLDERESEHQASRLIAETCEKQGIGRDQLTIHADRGSAMISKTVSQLIADLGVTKTHSRPHTSNDNPYSEAQFKTLKYCPTFPGSFGSIEDANAFLRAFFAWYNTEHHHSGIGYFTPEQLHYGRAKEVQQQRRTALLAAYSAHPERFVNGVPEPAPIPTAAWINPPAAPGGADDPPKPSKAKAEEEAQRRELAPA